MRALLVLCFQPRTRVRINAEHNGADVENCNPPQWRRNHTPNIVFRVHYVQSLRVRLIETTA
jgi:hypothetical protein